MRKLLTIFAVVLVALLGVKIWYSGALAAPCKGKANAETTITIDKGESADSVAAKLKKAGVIKSERAFKTHVKNSGVAKDFKAGQHTVSCAIPASQNAAKLAEEPESHQFTIKEGVSQATIAELLAKRGIVTKDGFKSLKASDFPEYEFLKDAPKDADLEGFLFPETYAVPPAGTSDKDVARIMLDQFKKVYETELNKGVGAAGRPVKNFYETVIIASMVEEEVRSDEDRRVVAGIMYRRLNEDIRLDIDATVRYALAKPTQPLTKDDLDSDSPYNTRKFKGLPPGPITNPGVSALRAALNPEASDYLFYLSDKQGVTRYAKTNAEHEANIEQYLR